jgi:hypothetical protein
LLRRDGHDSVNKSRSSKALMPDWPGIGEIARTGSK